MGNTRVWKHPGLASLKKKGGFSKGGFRRNSQIFIAPLCMYICTATWHPMCPLATSPCLSTLLVCLSSICYFKGCHVSWRQTRYRTTCKVAERKYRTAFDKSEKYPPKRGSQLLQKKNLLRFLGRDVQDVGANMGRKIFNLESQLTELLQSW